MKDVYFQILDFEGRMPKINEFQDFGYVPQLLDKTKELFRKLGQPDDEEYIKQCGIDVDLQRENYGGFHMRITNYPVDNSKTSYIYYNKFNDKSINLWNRAHEEAHAVCHIGLKGKLEKRMGLPNLECGLWEEDFCDQAGLYALRQKDIEPHPSILIPYTDREVIRKAAHKNHS